MKRLVLLLAAANALAGCTAFDLWNEPDVVVEPRECRVDSDCDNVRFEVAERLRNDACLVAVRLCDSGRDMCTVEIRARDSDEDNFRDMACDGVQTRFPPFAVDCDDANATAYPGADLDGDGFPVVGCGAGAPEDCDDSRATAYPGATVEACDGVESRCTGTAPPARRVVEDFDDDRFSPVGLDASVCSDVTGTEGNLLSYPRTDCDDADRFVFPNAPDVCDGRHNDCNAAVGVGRDVGEDVDGDGFASPTSLSCNPDLEGGPEYTDCDDVNPKTYPGARESCDGIINDCTARPQFDITRAVEDPDTDGYYAGNADCIDPYVHIESVSSAFDRFAVFAPPGLEATLETSLPGVRYLRPGDYDNNNLEDMVSVRDDGTTSCVTGDVLKLYYSVSSNIGTTFCLPEPNAVDTLVVDADGDSNREIVTLFASGNVSVLDASPTLTAKPAMGITVANGAFTIGRIADVATPVVIAVEGTQLQSRPLDANSLAGAATVIDASAGSVAGLFLADLNGDGKSDVIARPASGATLRVYAGAAAGAFGAATTIDAAALLPGIGDVKDVLVGDVEGASDGDLDLVVVGTGGFGVLAQRGASFEGVTVGIAPSGQSLAMGAIIPGSVTVRDLGNDGAAEIVYTEPSRDSVGYIEELGTNLFAQHVFVADFELASAVTTADYDGDGDVDVLAYSPTLGQISRFTSRFLTNQAYGGRVVDRAFSVVSAASADFNLDGLRDFVGASGLPGGDVIVWRSRATDFVVSDELLVTRADGGESITGVAAADVTDDTLPDIVLASEGLDRVSLARGVGDGSFAARENLPTFDAARAVAVADLDADGRVEIIVASNGGTEGRLAVYALPASATSFSRTIVASGSAACDTLSLGDVDDDGDVDIGASCGLDGVFVLLNPGTIAGTWTERTLDDGSLAAANTTSLALLDMDRDGDADVVTYRADLSSLLIHVASGGTFAAPTTHAVSGPGASGARIAGADIDRDGDFDLVVAGIDLGSPVRVLQTLGGARSRFVPYPLFNTTVMARVSAIVVSDLNKDGDDDLFFSIEGDRDIVVYRSATTPWWAN